jgi:hypothetical protein
MAITIDPIILLKDHIQQNLKIEKVGNYLIFSDTYKLRVDTPTACAHSTFDKYYTLGCIWFYLKNKNLPFTTYIKESQNQKIEFLNSIDKGKKYPISD